MTVRVVPELMSVNEVALECGVTARTVRRWIHDGLLPSVALPSGRRVVMRDDLRGAVERTHRAHSDRSADQRHGRMKA